MSEDSEGTKLTSVDLARQFYEAHAAAFAAAAAKARTEDRRFDFTADQFDDWAVSAGHMTKAVRHAAGPIESKGLVKERFDLRARINRAARKSQNLLRGFSIEARAGHWRVILAERYFQECPSEDGGMIARLYDRVGRNVARRRKDIQNIEYLADDERLMIRAQEEYLSQYAFWSAQHLHTLTLRLDPNCQEPDMRKLGRDMGRLVTEAFQGKPSRRKAKPAQLQPPAA
jgi:hypothetical protein